ncbi:MAG: thioredoxin domain-containing protein [Candidatus Pacebacteria bacterium]|nr:thioredoxin domain-containing protein [Candidatus Paceibacterota bacterium]
MKQEIKVVIGIIIGTIIIIIGGLWIASSTQKPTGLASGAKADSKILIRAGSPLISGSSTSLSVGDEASSSVVTLVEFADFECPACMVFAPTLRQAIAHYGSKVQLIFRTFPIHPNAPADSLAALAAGDQGKFWEMYDLLYKNQNEWTAYGANKTALFASYATSLGLDINKFNADLKSAANKATVDQDTADGNALGVDRTPSLFIDGTLVTGAISYETLTSLIDAELAKNK